MDFPNLKELKKLIALCKKSGITHFKWHDIEFNLDLFEQPKVVNSAKKTSPSAPQASPDPLFYTDTLTDEQMLFWSAEKPGMGDKDESNPQ